MKNLFTIIFYFLVGLLPLTQVYSQGCKNSNLGFTDVHVDPWNLIVGQEGEIVIPFSAIGCAGVPQYAVLIEVSVTDQLDLGNCVLVDDYGIWETIYYEYANNATAIWIQNTKGSLDYQINLFDLKIHFTAVTPTSPKGTIVANVGYLNPYCLDWYETNPTDNGDWDEFVVSLPTPINLGPFSANVKDCNSIEINWTTYSETNVDRIEVQKSYDGRNFETVTAQKSKGNVIVKSNYSVVDTAPLQPGKVYYRLKTIDLDGSISYSRIIPVTVNCGLKKDIIVYPNPTYGPTSVQFSGFKAGSALKVALMNAQGQVLRTMALDPVEKNSLDLSDYPGGVYFLKVLDDQSTLRAKIIKVN